MKTKYVVTVNLPEGVTAESFRLYIKEAVACWKGADDPSEPIYDYDGKPTVKTIKSPTLVQP